MGTTSGILTGLCLLIVFCLGVFRQKAPAPMLRWHKRMGVVTVIVGLVHGTYMLFFH